MGAPTSDSGAFSGRTRDDISHTFGVIGRRIAERFERAQRVQLLDRVGGGYKGHPALWRAIIPTHPECADSAPYRTQSVRFSAPDFRTR